MGRIPTVDEIRTAAVAGGCPVDEPQAEDIVKYLDILIKWNAKMNLVGPRRWRGIFDTLMVDCLKLAEFLPGLDLPENPVCLDLGAGAGLPGIPLRIVWDAGHYTMIDSRQKRVAFIRTALGVIKPANTFAWAGRAEEVVPRILSEQDCEGADLIVSRAFMPWRELLEFVAPMLAPQGRVLVMSNEPAPDDLPAGWVMHVTEKYATPAGKRYFWGLTPDSCSR